MSANDNIDGNIDRTFMRRLDMRQRQEFYARELSKLYEDLEAQQRFTDLRQQLLTPLDNQIDFGDEELGIGYDEAVYFSNIITGNVGESMGEYKNDYFFNLFAPQAPFKLHLVAENPDVVKSNRPPAVMYLVKNED